MKVINSSNKSKVYRNGDKVYKFNSQSNDSNFQRELRMYEKMKSHNIPNVIEYTMIDEKVKMIEMEYYPYNLEKLLAGEYKINITKSKMDEITYKIINTLKHMHNKLIIHGDFKAKNIMLDRHLNPIIIDFDLSSVYLKDYNKVEINTKIQDDLKKLHYLIYQLLYKVEYKPELYNNYDIKMKEIENNFPDLYAAMMKQDINKMIEHFKNK